MLLWLAYEIVAVITMLLCYLTNPIVVLFADEDGELHGWLHYAQTWDDSLDSEYFMTEVCPKWLDYGYYEHYTPYCGIDTWTAEYNKTRQFSVADADAVWTVKQRIQRYICRVWWLTRNCGYGFAFFLLGADMTNIKWHINEDDRFFGTVGNILTEPFCYSDSRQICDHLRWEIYLGWKTYPSNTEPQRCMIANRLLIRVVL